MTQLLVAGLAVAAGVFAATTALLARTLRALSHDSTRRDVMYTAQISELVDRTMYMANRPWTPAPIELQQLPEQPEAELILLPDDLRLEEMP